MDISVFVTAYFVFFYFPFFLNYLVIDLFSFLTSSVLYCTPLIFTFTIFFPYGVYLLSGSSSNFQLANLLNFCHSLIYTNINFQDYGSSSRHCFK